MSKKFSSHGKMFDHESSSNNNTSHSTVVEFQSTSTIERLQGCIPKRFIFSFIGFLASTLAVTLNTNFSLAIVSMVDRSNESVVQVKKSNECLSNYIPDTDLAMYRQSISLPGEFHWSPETEGFLLGCVYYGQLFGFLPGGRMAEVYGSKRTLIGFMLLASLCTFICPIAARLSVYAFAACRFLIGIGTAPVVPVSFHLISRWIPDSERSFNASFILAGFGVGAFVSFLTAGVLCGSDFLGGWPAVFYLGGTCGFLWCLLCYIFVYDKPSKHPTISQKELKYITENLGTTQQKQIKKIPWKSMILSRPFWSLAIGYFGQFWVLGFYCTTQALYMGTILNVESKLNGELSCVPHLIRGLFACVCGFPVDWFLKRGYVSKGLVRKGATAVTGCNPTLNTIFFTVGGLLADFITFGVCMAGVDIAPNLSGTISGILSFVGVIPFFVIPALVGFVTRYERSMAQWHIVYYTTIGVVALTTLVYVIFGTSKPQTWGTFDEEVASDEKEDLTSELKPEDC